MSARVRKWITVHRSAWFVVIALVAVWSSNAFFAERTWLTWLVHSVPQVGYLVLPVALLVCALIRKKWKVAALSLGLIASFPPLFLGYELPTPMIESDHDFVVVSYNVHGGESPFPPIVATLRQIGADVVCLQESGGARDSTRIEELARSIGLENIVQNGDIAILSRYPTVRSEVVFLDGNPRSRDIVEVTLDIDGTEVTIVTVHLIPMLLDYAWRAGFPGAIDVMRQTSQVGLAQAEFLRRRYGKRSGPIVITGDFNFSPHGERYREMSESFTDAFSFVGTGFGYTIRSDFPTMRIDYAWTRNLFPVSCSPYPATASDHKPLVTRLRTTES